MPAAYRMSLPTCRLRALLALSNLWTVRTLYQMGKTLFAYSMEFQRWKRLHRPYEDR